MKFRNMERKLLTRVAEIARRRLEELGEIHSLVEEIKSRLAGMGGEFELKIEKVWPYDHEYEIILRVQKPEPAIVRYTKSLYGGQGEYSIECMVPEWWRCKEVRDAIIDEFKKQVNAAIGDLLEKLEEKRDLVVEYGKLKNIVDTAEHKLKGG